MQLKFFLCLIVTAWLLQTESRGQVHSTDTVVTGNLTTIMLPVQVDSERLLWLSADKKGLIRGQIIHANGSADPARIISPTDYKLKITENFFLTWLNFLSCVPVASDQYHLYVRSLRDRTVYAILMDMTQTKAARSTTPVITYSKQEKYVGSISTEDQLVVLTIDKRSSRLHLYVLQRGDTSAAHIEANFDYETFPITNFETLYSALLAGSKPEIDALAIPRLLDAPFHQVGGIADYPNKLYLDSERKQVVLTIEQSHDYNLVLNLPLDGREVSVHRFPGNFSICENRLGFPLPTCSYADGKIWQFQGCKESLRVQVFDLDTDALVTRDSISREDLLANGFPQFPSVGTSSLLDGLLAQPFPADRADPKLFFAGLGQFAPRVSTRHTGIETISLRLQILKENQASTLLSNLAGMTSVALFGSGMLFAPDLFTQTINCDVQFNRLTLDPVAVGFEEREKTEAIETAIVDISKEETIIQFWILGAYLWAGVPIKKPARGYALRRVQLVD